MITICRSPFAPSTRPLAAVAVMLGIALAPVAARAQSASPDAVALSKQRFEEGRALATAERWSEACPKFEEAHRLNPTGGTAMQLGNCFERTGRFREAHDLFLWVLTESEPSPERARVARDRVKELRGRLGPEEKPPPAKPQQAASSTPPPAAGPAPAPPAGEGPSRVPAYVAFGVGGAGLAVGSIFGVLALTQMSSVRSSCNGDVCPADQRDESDAAQTKAWIANAGFGVAVAGAALGVVLLVTSGSSSSVSARADGLRLRF